MNELKPNKIKTILKAFYTETIKQIDRFTDKFNPISPMLTHGQGDIDESFDLEAKKRKLEIEKRKLRIAKQKLGIKEQDTEIREKSREERDRELEIKERNVEIAERDAKIAMQKAEKVNKIIAWASAILVVFTLIFIAYMPD